MFLGAIPFVFFVLCTLVVFSLHQEGKDGINARVVLLTACIISSVWLVAGTELLSVFRGISFWPVLLWWTAPSIGMLFFLARRRKRLRNIRLVLPSFEALDWLLLIPTILLLISVGLSAWFSAPNNWDSMLYHLPRQVYWIQNHTVAHYPTTRTFQIVMPPFSEFMGMHLMLLSGGDRWANMVQCFSFAMVMVVVSLIARDLGANRRGQILAAFLVSSAPTVYIFASNTKNDVVLALWVCLLAWWAVRIFIDRNYGTVRALLVGSTLGLALLTKGTSYFFIPASCLLIGIGIIRSTRRFAKPTVVIMISAILLNSGHWIRNYRMFGSPIGYNRHMNPEVNTSFVGPAALMSNAFRNITLHLGTPSERFNSGLERSVDNVHALLGIDPQDPRITFIDTEYGISYWPHHEDSTPAGAHVVLIGLTLILALPFRRWLPERLLYMYLAIPCAGFALFCLMLQWTPWHTRLHIPLLCLFMPAIAVVLTRTPGRFVRPLAVVGIFISLYPTFVVNYRPLLGKRSIFKTDRTSQMFHGRPELLAGSVAVADLVAEIKPRSVGFGRDWEYPLQRLILDRMETPPRFCSFDARWLKPQVKVWPIDPEPPEMVIVMDRVQLSLSDQPSDTKYGLVACMEPYGVYAREDATERGGSRWSLPPFFGWSVAKGLSGEEGPYPQWELPVVRWGLGPRTELTFEADGRPLVLAMVCGTHHLQWQRITILLNGEQVGQYSFDHPGEFRDIHIPITSRAGRNSLTIEYETEDRTEPEHPLALLFRRLRIDPPELSGRGTETDENA